MMFHKTRVHPEENLVKLSFKVQPQNILENAKVFHQERNQNGQIVPFEPIVLAVINQIE